MDRQAYKDEIIFKLTGGVLDIELDDASLDKLLNSAFREVQRYIDTTKIITIPYKQCIDLSEYKINAVVRVFRATAYTGNSETDSNSVADPMMVSQWQLLAGPGNLYNFQNYIYNYASWNTLLQMRNTLSTDLAFRYDKSSNQLYINVSSGTPDTITIEYVPRYDDVSEIVSDYWIDVIVRMSVALAKITLGRIRSRFTQSNALWTMDGDRLLEEGNAELSDLREKLLASTQLCYPID